MSGVLKVWTIYDRPRDHPQDYVVREWWVTAEGQKPQSWIWLAPTLEDARLCVPPGLHRLDRSPGDDPVIVETWL